MLACMTRKIVLTAFCCCIPLLAAAQATPASTAHPELWPAAHSPAALADNTT
jgi:hypothetical protein